MNDGNAKQQIVEKIKSSSNILITVSTDPSVDELSAALGLTILLNKMNKHATAVFSGAIPPAMTFLDPQKTFENSVDSLRDFIIALDKEKADHLRYKVEGEVVKIFITPYRTTITSDDLDFSQGDYNVELVLALGVDKRENLDAALTAHGRILHDATVATMSVGDMKSELGGMNWREQNASSLSEMLMSLSESLKSGKAVVDEQIATAFLTGIVAATDRFSNNKTSSKVMTMAAQLMAAGANQQLIASKLAEANEIGQAALSATAFSDQTDQQASGHPDGTTDLSEGESTKLNTGTDTPQPATEAPAPKEDDGSLSISHMPVGDVDEVAALTATAQQADAFAETEDQLEKRSQEVAAQQQTEAARVAENTLAQQLSDTLPPVVAGELSVADLQQDLAAASADVELAAEQPVVDAIPEAPAAQTAPDVLSGAVGPDAWQDNAPSVGGTLNATTEQAADDKRREDAASRNRTILTHGGSSYLSDTEVAPQSPINAASLPSDEPSIADPFAQLTPPADTSAPTSYAPSIEPLSPTLADLDQQNRMPPHDEARAAVDAAFGSIEAPSDIATPAPQPSPFDLPPAPSDPFDPAGLPPLPDFSTLPPLPTFDDGPVPDRLEDAFQPVPAPAPQTPASPGQFRIPGQ